MLRKRGFFGRKAESRTEAHPTVAEPSPQTADAVEFESQDPEGIREEAAEFLASYLPEEVQGLIREAQQGQGVALWKMLLGYVMRAADNAELFVPYQLGVWESGRRPNEPRPCGTCGQLFSHRLPDARYCCARCYFGKLAEQGHDPACPIRQLLSVGPNR